MASSARTCRSFLPAALATVLMLTMSGCSSAPHEPDLPVPNAHAGDLFAKAPSGSVHVTGQGLLAGQVYSRIEAEVDTVACAYRIRYAHMEFASPDADKPRKITRTTISELRVVDGVGYYTDRELPAGQRLDLAPLAPGEVGSIEDLPSPADASTVWNVAPAPIARIHHFGAPLVGMTAVHPLREPCLLLRSFTSMVQYPIALSEHAATIGPVDGGTVYAVSPDHEGIRQVFDREARALFAAIGAKATKQLRDQYTTPNFSGILGRVQIQVAHDSRGNLVQFGTVSLDAERRPVTDRFVDTVRLGQLDAVTVEVPDKVKVLPRAEY